MLRLLFLRKNRKWGTELITPESEENVNFNEHFFKNHEKIMDYGKKQAKNQKVIKLSLKNAAQLLTGGQSKGYSSTGYALNYI